MERLDWIKEEYEKTIRIVAQDHGVILLNISDHDEQIINERQAEDLERIRRGNDAVGLRISGVLFFLSKGQYEDAAYQMSRAGKDALFGRDKTLCGKIRHISALMFMHLLDVQEGVGHNYDRYMQNICFGFLEAAEGYFKGGNNKAGLRAFGHFERFGRKTNFNHRNMDLSLRHIKEHYPDLSERITHYCIDVRSNYQ